jgi:hypothetical protein
VALSLPLICMCDYAVQGDLQVADGRWQERRQVGVIFVCCSLLGGCTVLVKQLVQ